MRNETIAASTSVAIQASLRWFTELLCRHRACVHRSIRYLYLRVPAARIRTSAGRRSYGCLYAEGKLIETRERLPEYGTFGSASSLMIWKAPSPH